MSKVLDAKYINTQLDQVDEQGWDGTAARELLERIRCQVIRPVINGYGLTDATASQAEATAWEETWRALCRPSIRTTDNPGLLLLVVARRSVHAELNSQRYATSPDKAARRYQETRAEGEEPRNMISLEIALENGLQLSQASNPADEDGALLSRIADAMTAAGWDRAAAHALLAALSSTATRSPGKAYASPPWRWVSRTLDLPEWQVRRVAALLAGGEEWPGLVELLIDHGPSALQEPNVVSGIRATRNRWSPSTQHWLASAAMSTPGPCRPRSSAPCSLTA
jgi:hypothetical protein